MEKILETVLLRFFAAYIGENLEPFLRFLSILKSDIDSGDKTIDHVIEEIDAWLKTRL